MASIPLWVGLASRTGTLLLFCLSATSTFFLDRLLGVVLGNGYTLPKGGHKVPNKIAKGKRKYSFTVIEAKVEALRQAQREAGVTQSLSAAWDAWVDRIIENYRKGVKNESKGI